MGTCWAVLFLAVNIIEIVNWIQALVSAENVIQS